MECYSPTILILFSVSLLWIGYICGYHFKEEDEKINETELQMLREELDELEKENTRLKSGKS